MTYKVTDAIAANSSRGLALLQKAKSLASTAAKAQVQPLIKNLGSSLELSEVQALYFFLLKAKDKYRPNELKVGYNVTSDTASFLAAGGNAAIAWCSDIINKQNKKQAEANTEDKIPGIDLQITKALNEELMQATFVVLVPEETDLHGDVISESEVRKACHNFNKYCNTANLFHLAQTDSFEFAESYICPTDIVLDNKFVKKGTWLCTIQCLDDNLWALIKSGDICAVSIGALAKTELVEED